MSSSGYLVPPEREQGDQKLWVETWKRLDRFLPDLKKELDFATPVPAPSNAESTEEITVAL